MQSSRRGQARAFVFYENHLTCRANRGYIAIIALPAGGRAIAYAHQAVSSVRAVCDRRLHNLVMPGHPRLKFPRRDKAWMAGTSPAMTLRRRQHESPQMPCAIASLPEGMRWLTRLRNMLRSLHGQHSKEASKQFTSRPAATNGSTPRTVARAGPATRAALRSGLA